MDVSSDRHIEGVCQHSVRRCSINILEASNLIAKNKKENFQTNPKVVRISRYLKVSLVSRSLVQSPERGSSYGAMLLTTSKSPLFLNLETFLFSRSSRKLTAPFGRLAQGSYPLI